jgi:RimJ/RimL family protein N-acetyltransferase
MELHRYGISLRRIQESEIERLRLWRNEDKISRFMFHQGAITPEMQLKWFQSVNNSANHFFLILVEQEAVGLINASAIDRDQGTAFSGLFIYEDRFLATEVPVCASLCMLDFLFSILNLKEVYAKVRGNNRRAHQYNSALGFRRIKKIELGLGYEYRLSQTDYFREAERLRAYASRRFGEQGTILLQSSDSVDQEVHSQLQSGNMAGWTLQLI